MPLHAESEAFLAAVAARNARAWYEMPLSEARDTFNHLGVFGTGPELHRVADTRTESGVGLRIYQRDSTPDDVTVVYFHGGGWVLGNLDTHDTLCRRLSSVSGANVVAVDYRCAPEFPCPAALHDCLEATELVRRNGTQLGLNSSRVIVAGDSAGGNLACGVAIRSRDSGQSVDGQLLIYPVVSPRYDTDSYRTLADGFGLTRQTMIWFWEQYLGRQTAESDVDLLAEGTSLSGLPPTFIAIAEYDVLRSECESLAAKLLEAGNVVQARQFDGLLHGFLHFSDAFPSGQSAFDDLANAIHDMVRPE